MAYRTYVDLEIYSSLFRAQTMETGIQGKGDGQAILKRQ